MTNHQRTLGTYLREARTAAGFSIRGLAEQAGIGHPYLVKLEHDQNDRPSADILQRLADALGIEAGELLGYIGVKPASTLPSPRVYFRRKLGINADEAAVLAKLIEDYQQAKQKGG